MGLQDSSPAALGDLVRVKHGFAFKGEGFRSEETPHLLITPGNFAVGGGFQFRPGRETYFAGDVPAEYVLAPGDLVVTMTDLSRETDTLGYPALVPSIEGLSFLHNQRIGRVSILDETVCERQYLYYLMCSREYREEILASATGSTVKHTAPSRIEAFKFNLPGLDEQRAIARILGPLDDKIEVNRRMNRTLEALAKKLFRSWFVDFDPTVAKSEGRKPPGLSDKLAALFASEFEDSEQGPIPHGWTVAPLDSLAEFRNGLAMQKFPPGPGESLPVLKIAELRAGSTVGADQASVDLDPRFVVDDGDLIFSWSGSLLVDVWAGGKAALNQHLFKVIPNDVPQWFCHHWLLEHLDDFQSIAADKATTMGHIRRHHLTDAKIVRPSEALLQELDRVIAPLAARQLQNKLQMRKLAALRDLLLPKLLSGEIRVGAAERVVEEVT